MAWQLCHLAAGHVGHRLVGQELSIFRSVVCDVANPTTNHLYPSTLLQPFSKLGLFIILFYQSALDFPQCCSTCNRVWQVDSLEGRLKGNYRSCKGILLRFLSIKTSWEKHLTQILSETIQFWGILPIFSPYLARILLIPPRFTASEIVAPPGPRWSAAAWEMWFKEWQFGVVMIEWKNECNLPIYK